MKKLEAFTVQDLKTELHNRGYYTDSLWSIYDVKEIFKVTEAKAQTILHNALTNEATMDQIWFAIREFGELDNCKKIKEPLL